MDLKKCENWFFDIDDTIIDTAGVNVLAANGIHDFIVNTYGTKKSKEFTKTFIQLFDLMLLGYRIKNEDEWIGKENEKKEFQLLVERIEYLQKPVKMKWGAIKKWSREVFIKIAAEKNGMSMSPNFISDAANTYWLTLTKNTIIFPGAVKLINKLHRNNLGVYFITSSDGRLTMRTDGFFEYEPNKSEALKRQRIELLKNRGIHYDVLTIGDPEDKPHISFFQKGIDDVQKLVRHSINSEECVMIGDSFAGDLQTPLEKLGFGHVVLFEKLRNQFELNGKLIKLGDLGIIADMI